MAERRKHDRAPIRSKARALIRAADGPHASGSGGGPGPDGPRGNPGRASRPGHTASRPGHTGSGRPTGRRALGAFLHGLARLVWLPVLSALLLTLAFPPAEVSWLAYVALVPMLIAAVRARSGRDAFFGALVGGIVFFAVNLYWVQPITTAGYLALLPYMALYWAVWAAVMRSAARLHVPLALAAPAVWVTLEWVRGWMISGLPWLFVGHTQYENLTLIQTADALGAYGVSALCLVTTGFLAAALVRPILVPQAADPSHDRASPSRDREGAAGEAAPSQPGPESAAGAETRRAGFPAGHAGRATQDSRSPRMGHAVLVNLVVLVVAWAGTVGYGVYRLGEDARTPGPVVASVQTCVPQEVKNLIKMQQVQTEEDYRRMLQEIADAEHEMLDTQVRLTGQALAEARARDLKPDLVVWPETMVPGIVNEAFLTYDPDVLAAYPSLARRQEESRTYWRRIQATAREAAAPILFGCHSNDLERDAAGRMRFVANRNAALMVGPDTPLYTSDGAYAKAHLVPFGEYVPFKQSWPWLYNLLRSFTPYEYDYSLTPGGHDQPPFVIGYDGHDARFQVAICYEDAMAYRIREMVEPVRNAECGMRNERRNGNGQPATGSTDGAAPFSRDAQRSAGSSAGADQPTRKAVDFLVNISNDGWFNGSWELDQHLNLCVFRAVENRVPIVRSVNTGISAIIQSTGHITQVVEKDGRRRSITGTIVGRVDLDRRLAPYTTVGDAFAYGCALATAVMLVAAVAGRVHRRNESSGKEPTP